MNSQNKPRVIKLPGQQLRSFATALLKVHPLHSSPFALSSPSTDSLTRLKIVCVSDTHNTQPELPPGDVLIHAGDLTENGSFDEVQAQLAWLSSKPHRYKLLVAGNHDVLLDETFLEKYPERKYGQTKTMRDLDWGSVSYLRESSITLEFSNDDHSSNDKSDTRILNVYGSPWTPQYGVSAFQYPRDEDIWTNKIPSDVDIVVTHGPPRLHLDTQGFHRAGCSFLSQEIARIRPKLVVFGHIHVSFGREDVVLDRARRAYEEIISDWAGWKTLIWLAMCVLFARLVSWFVGKAGVISSARVTTFVNAAVVGGRNNELQNKPIVVEM